MSWARIVSLRIFLRILSKNNIYIYNICCCHLTTLVQKQIINSSYTSSIVMFFSKLSCIVIAYIAYYAYLSLYLLSTNKNHIQKIKKKMCWQIQKQLDLSKQASTLGCCVCFMGFSQHILLLVLGLCVCDGKQSASCTPFFFILICAISLFFLFLLVRFFF